MLKKIAAAALSLLSPNIRENEFLSHDDRRRVYENKAKLRRFGVALRLAADGNGGPFEMANLIYNEIGLNTMAYGSERYTWLVENLYAPARRVSEELYALERSRRGALSTGVPVKLMDAFDEVIQSAANALWQSVSGLALALRDGEITPGLEGKLRCEVDNMERLARAAVRAREALAELVLSGTRSLEQYRAERGFQAFGCAVRWLSD